MGVGERTPRGKRRTRGQWPYRPALTRACNDSCLSDPG